MNANTKIYLDHAATTPVDRRVLDAMLPYFSEIYGNPSSIHFYGQQAEAAVEAERESVARLIHAQPDEIYFTSGGSESDNLAIRGTALARRETTGASRIIVSPVEHQAVLHTVIQLRDLFGFTVDYLPVDRFGMVDPDDLKDRLGQDVALVSVIYANNEIGTINPIGKLGRLCRAAGVPFHTDAVQAAAHLPMDVQHDQIDLLALGAHKFYGPKGVGVLYKRHDLKIFPTQTGGGQESGLRSGTQNVPYIVGLGKAFELANLEQKLRQEKVVPLRDKILGTVLEEIPGAQISGHPTDRLPNHASFVFEHLDGNNLLVLLDAAGFACSSGSACKVGDPKPSEVLQAMGVPVEWVMGSLRVTLGKDNTAEEINRFLSVLPNLVGKARSLN